MPSNRSSPLDFRKSDFRLTHYRTPQEIRPPHARCYNAVIPVVRLHWLAGTLTRSRFGRIVLGRGQLVHCYNGGMSERPQDRRDRLINQMVDVSGRLDRTNDLSEQNDLQALLRALGSALWLEVQPESTARDVPRAKGQANIERAAELDAVLDAPRDRLSSLTVLSWVALHAEREAIRKLLAENETE
jgi:hypothetical protein